MNVYMLKIIMQKSKRLGFRKIKKVNKNTKGRYREIVSSEIVIKKQLKLKRKIRRQVKLCT